jgi:hypothetical protein
MFDTNEETREDTLENETTEHIRYRNGFFHAMKEAGRPVNPKPDKIRTFNQTSFEREMAAKVLIIMDSFGGSYGPNRLLLEGATCRVCPGFTPEMLGIGMRYILKTRKALNFPDPQYVIIYAGMNDLYRRESPRYRQPLRKLSTKEIKETVDQYTAGVRSIAMEGCSVSMYIVLPPNVRNEFEDGHQVPRFRHEIYRRYHDKNETRQFITTVPGAETFIVPFENLQLILLDPLEIHPFPMQTPYMMAAMEDAFHLAGHPGIQFMSETHRAVAEELQEQHTVMLSYLMKMCGDENIIEMARAYYDWQRDNAPKAFKIPLQPTLSVAKTPFEEAGLTDDENKGFSNVLAKVQRELRSTKKLELPEPRDWPQPEPVAEAGPHARLIQTMILGLADEIPDTARIYRVLEIPLKDLDAKLDSLEYARERQDTRRPEFVRLGEDLPEGAKATNWTKWNRQPDKIRGGATFRDTTLMDHIVAMTVHGYAAYEMIGPMRSHLQDMMRNPTQDKNRCALTMIMTLMSAEGLKYFYGSVLPTKPPRKKYRHMMQQMVLTLIKEAQGPVSATKVSAVVGPTPEMLRRMISPPWYKALFGPVMTSPSLHVDQITGAATPYICVIKMAAALPNDEWPEVSKQSLLPIQQIRKASFTYPRDATTRKHHTVTIEHNLITRVKATSRWLHLTRGPLSPRPEEGYETVERIEQRAQAETSVTTRTAMRKEDYTYMEFLERCGKSKALNLSEYRKEHAMDVQTPEMLAQLTDESKMEKITTRTGWTFRHLRTADRMESSSEEEGEIQETMTLSARYADSTLPRQGSASASAGTAETAQPSRSGGELATPGVATKPS